MRYQYTYDGTAVLFCIGVIIVFLAVMCAPLVVWLLQKYLGTKNGTLSSTLPSKLWYCKKCWYSEYARTPRICPTCSREHYLSETWNAPEMLSRGIPNHESMYHQKHMMLHPDSSD